MDDNSKGSTTDGRSGKASSAGNLVQVEVANLQMGMYIVELDRPWLETPFLMQGFELRNKAQLRTLEKYCQHVYIQGRSTVAKKQGRPSINVKPPKSMGKAEEGTMLKHEGRVKKPKKRRVFRSRPAYEPTSPVREEHPQAEKAYRKGKSAIKKILHSAQFGQMLNTEAAEDVVASCVDSMLRNPDAMIWMSRIKHENEYLQSTV